MSGQEAELTGQIVLSRVFIDETRMLECWTYAGLATRMIVPLGLNVRSAELSMKSVMLPPPADALEREERRATVWMAFHHDTVSPSYMKAQAGQARMLMGPDR